jgi:hypothetical protein
MQAADRGVRIPGAVGPVLLEDAGASLGVVGEVFEADRAVFEKRDRLPVAFSRDPTGLSNGIRFFSERSGLPIRHGSADIVNGYRY